MGESIGPTQRSDNVAGTHSNSGVLMEACVEGLMPGEVRNLRSDVVLCGERPNSSIASLSLRRVIVIVPKG